MEWTLRLVRMGIDGQSQSFEVMTISRPDGLGDIANLGITLCEVKQLLVQVQQQVVADQATIHATFRNQLRARLSALTPYGVAGDVLQYLLPIDAGTSPETMRSHTLRVGKQLGEAEKPPAAAAAITISLDSTFIRSCEDGRTDTTEVTAFTDGCPGLRAVLINAGVTKPPILDWFHIAMRLQYAVLIAANLSTDDANRVTAKATIINEVEPLHWRISNGKAKNAQRSIKRIRKVVHVFKGERSHGAKGVASRKLWHTLHAVDKYLIGRAAWLVNYAKRFRAGLRVGTSITEGTANFFVNRRMNKSQQMRWSRNGADLLLQVRCAVYNGTLGAGFGRRFDRMSNADPTLAEAA